MPAVDELMVTPGLLRLAEAVQTVASVSAAELPASVALADLRGLLAVTERLGVVVLERLADMDARQLYDDDGLGSTGAWVQAQGTSVDRTMVRLARRVDRLPQVGAALRAGELSISTAQRVARAVEQVRGFLDRPDGLIDGLPGEQVLRAVIVDGVRLLVGEALGGIDDDDLRLRRLTGELTGIADRPVSQVARVEAALLLLAGRVDPPLLGGCLRRLVDALLPQQLEDGADRAYRDRALTLVPHHDRPGGRLEADLDAEAYELAHAALAAAMAGDPENPTDTALAAAAREAEDDPYLPGPNRAPRSLSARRHDALRTVLADWLGKGLAGVRGKALPHVAVTVGLDCLNGAPGALPAVGGSGMPLPASLVRRWACESWISRFVMSLGHRVIETSHTARTLKAHERRAKLVETGGRCQIAGCDTPHGAPLVPHHANAWAGTHETSFSDTALVCDHCHHDLHEGGRILRLRDGRLLGPDGWVQPGSA